MKFFYCSDRRKTHIQNKIVYRNLIDVLESNYKYIYFFEIPDKYCYNWKENILGLKSEKEIKNYKYIIYYDNYTGFVISKTKLKQWRII